MTLGQEFVSKNPATNEIVFRGKAATQDEIKSAVQKSKEAFLSWKKTELTFRAAILWKFATLLSDSFAELISQEMGKPLWDAKQEVLAMKNKIESSIQAYHERCPQKVHKQLHGEQIIRHAPHGPCLVFGPFNFPGHLPNGHIVPALLAGNTVLFKPSELTPKVGEALGLLWQEAGLPAYVLQVLQGAKEVGQALLEEPDIRAVFFTGSAAARKSILEQSLAFPDRIVAIEAGGNNPLIVSAVQDVEKAVQTTLSSSFLTSGQRCSCVRRLILVGEQKEFLERLSMATKGITCGPYTMTPEPFMGPLVTEHAAESVYKKYEGLVAQGGKVVVEMTRNGAFVTPGIIDVTGIKVEDEEIFGPCLQVIRTKNLAEAIACANSTRFGLTAGILSKERKEYEEVLDKVRAGIINWNAPLTGSSSMAPFGGLGVSGNFRPAGYYSADYTSYPITSTIQEVL